MMIVVGFPWPLARDREASLETRWPLLAPPVVEARRAWGASAAAAASVLAAVWPKVDSANRRGR